MGSLHYLRSVRPVPKAETTCFDAFEREIDYLFWTLQRLGTRANDTEDLLQDIFAVLHRNWPTLDVTRPLRPWLFGVAFRVVQAHRRRQARETPRDDLDPTDAAPDPEAAVQNQEALEFLTSALQRVPEARRSVVVLHDLEGVEVSNIARQLSITRFGVYARLRKGRKELASAVRWLQRERVRT